MKKLLVFGIAVVMALMLGMALAAAETTTLLVYMCGTDLQEDACEDIYEMADAYTGDEVYMPIDLQCIWLISGTRVYNAAQYLRFRVSVSQPHFSWHIPAYNPYRRTTHSMGYQRSYHYNVHRHGWMPPAYTQGMTTPPLPPYYMRHRNQPAPMPTTRWTPGVERPTVRSTTPSAGAYTPVAPSSRSASSNANRNANQVTPTTPTSRSATGANSATSGKSENASTPTTTPTSRSANSNKTVSTSRSANSGNTTTQPSTPTSRSANSTRTVNTSRNTTTPTPSATTTPTSRSANNKSVERKVENSKQEVKKENVPAAAPASRSAKTTRR